MPGAVERDPMPGDETVAVALWAVGFLLVIGGVLVTIGRLAVYRYTGTFDPPWRRALAPAVAGCASLSVALVLLEAAVVVVWLWTGVGLAAGIVALVTRRRR